uniref:Uncharacterized protein n=1 Tax=Anopheles culicifacies TaxID=139723 RepID=A0A182MS68_9DIPT
MVGIYFGVHFGPSYRHHQPEAPRVNVIRPDGSVVIIIFIIIIIVIGMAAGSMIPDHQYIIYHQRIYRNNFGLGSGSTPPPIACATRLAIINGIQGANSKRQTESKHHQNPNHRLGLLRRESQNGESIHFRPANYRGSIDSSTGTVYVQANIKCISKRDN